MDFASHWTAHCRLHNAPLTRYYPEEYFWGWGWWTMYIWKGRLLEECWAIRILEGVGLVQGSSHMSKQCYFDSRKGKACLKDNVSVHPALFVAWLMDDLQKSILAYWHTFRRLAYWWDEVSVFASIRGLVLHLCEFHYQQVGSAPDSCLSCTYHSVGSNTILAFRNENAI